MEMESDMPSLWEVLYEAEYRDNDSDLCMADTRFFVLAKGYSEALKKAAPLLESYRKNHHTNVRVIANVVTLENLLPARNGENDGRLGWYSMHPLVEVNLSLDEDKKKFRLGICILPVE